MENLFSKKDLNLTSHMSIKTPTDVAWTILYRRRRKPKQAQNQKQY